MGGRWGMRATPAAKLREGAVHLIQHASFSLIGQLNTRSNRSAFGRSKWLWVGLPGHAI